MFGDMAHGLFLFLFGAWFIYKESYFEKRKHLLDEVSNVFEVMNLTIIILGDFFNRSWPNNSLIYTLYSNPCNVVLWPPYTQIIAMLYYGRYIIMMMGIFASYSGLLYNEIYSKGFDIFGSSWRMPNDDITWENLLLKAAKSKYK